ncbi:cardiolipin synthase [Bacillus mangrovi]|uniref:Cardiolipin synthase n=1 Tax=Metabacillus mangrovi TaxID=1491830 RepID=A0A7X2V4R3_9BACI|nr:phospholipase D-like domain-containing protein [Metabacillus mangrovi]MTH54057.1 cardiolipin synthase [Metabacillus mangrovi]
MGFFVGILLTLLVIVWLRLDFTGGFSRHIRKAGLQAYPIRQGGVQFFTEGQKFYFHYFQNIRQAKSSIFASFYIIKNDEEVSRAFLTLLGEKAKEGVAVYLLMDRLGSLKAPGKLLKEIRANGVKTAYSHTPRLPFLFFTLQARNHRKITVVDGQTGYLGGYNIGKEYIGKNPKLGKWRDYHLFFTGGGTRDLAAQFRRDWRNAGGEFIPEDKPAVSCSGISHRLVSTYGKLEDQYVSIIRQTQKELYICSPYFIPGTKLQTELLDVLARGVKVTIVVPMKSDHPFVKEAAFLYYGPLLKAGAEIHRFYSGFYHAKIVLSDDGFCDIGTANFDKRSLYLNDEMNVYIFDEDFTSRVKETIKKDIRNAEQLLYDDYLKRPLRQKAKERAANLLSLFL